MIVSDVNYIMGAIVGSCVIYVFNKWFPVQVDWEISPQQIFGDGDITEAKCSCWATDIVAYLFLILKETGLGKPGIVTWRVEVLRVASSFDTWFS